MKYRIIQRGDGKYKVQAKDKRSDTWNDVDCHCDDYVSFNPEDILLIRGVDRNDYCNGVFSKLSDAERKVESLIQEFKLEESRKSFNVIKECEV
jgi:hypothetical protein